MVRKKVRSRQGAVWTTKDTAAIRRLVQAGAKGQTIADEIGRSLAALYQKASIEGISLARTATVRRSVAVKKAKAFTASKKRRRSS